MKHASLNRRDFLKASTAGALAGVAAQSALAQGTPAGADAAAQVAMASAWHYRPAEKNAMFRSDMSRCTPTRKLTRSFETERWQLIEYETEEGVKGVMVSAPPDQDCGELTLPLEASGPAKIFLGINYTKAKFANEGDQLEVKLDNEPGFRRVSMEGGVNTETGDLKVGLANYNHKSIQEAYWKTADVTGCSLVFRQPDRRGADDGIANLSYVKLVPLTAAEVKAWKADRPTAATRRMGAIYCTAGLTSSTAGRPPIFHPTDEQWFRNEFAHYADSDFGVFIFEAMRGNFCVFKTKLGDLGNDDNRWEKDWVDPLATFARLARENGIKIFASQRMIGTQYPMNREPIARARYYWANQQWAKRDRNGTIMTTLSLAYPGTRAHWIGLLREALAYDIDGIQLHLNRSTPFVYYEEPVVKTFIERYKDDPRQLPETDPRWQKHCAGYVTDYLREVRALVDEKPGRELAVTIYGAPHKYDHDKSTYDPIRYGCDVDTWIREGIVNYVMPNPSIAPALLQRWRKLGGDRIHLWPDLMPRSQMGADYARLAKRYYDAGADGVFVWDSEGRAGRLSEWAAVQRLGHVAELDKLAAQATTFYRRVPLKSLAGFSARGSFHDG